MHDDNTSKGTFRHLSALMRKQHSCINWEALHFLLKSQVVHAKQTLSPETSPTFPEAALHIQLPRMTQGTPQDFLGTRGTQSSE